MLLSGDIYEFVINDALGDLVDPYIINVGTVTLSIEVAEGWNFFSVNVINGDNDPNIVLAGLDVEYGDIIKNQTLSATYYGDDNGWAGGLQSIDPESMYMISTSNPGVIELTGIPVDPEVTPISLTVGWNWIGYIPQSPIETNYALNKVVVAAGDVIKTHTAASYYYTDIGNKLYFLGII